MRVGVGAKFNCKQNVKTTNITLADNQSSLSRKNNKQNLLTESNGIIQPDNSEHSKTGIARVSQLSCVIVSVGSSTM